MARDVADRMGAIEVLDDHPADAIGGSVDHGVQLGADIRDHGDGRVEQVDLDAAVLVDPAARPVLVADTDRDPLNAVAVACQHDAQPAPHVLGQRRRRRESLSVDVDNHVAPPLRRQWLHARKSRAWYFP
jgi:hypothetical protein